jgi:hypothetical protein
VFWKGRNNQTISISFKPCERESVMQTVLFAGCLNTCHIYFEYACRRSALTVFGRNGMCELMPAPDSHVANWWHPLLTSYLLPVIREAASCFVCKESCPPFCGSGNFVNITVPYPEPAETTPHLIMSRKDILLCFSHLQLGLPCNFFGFPIKTPNAFISRRFLQASHVCFCLIWLLQCLVLQLTRFFYPV